MANAYFLNATPFSISINLNQQDVNHTLTAIALSDQLTTLYSWRTTIETYPREGFFGGNGVENYLTIFIHGGSLAPQVWEIRSSVPINLDLYFYVFIDKIAAVDQTGSSENISIQKPDTMITERLLQMISYPNV